MTTSLENSVDEKSLFAGIDVGGTDIKIGIVNNLGEVVASTRFPTRQEQGPQVAIDRSRDALNRLIETAGRDQSDVRAIGLGTPGPLDIPNGVILAPTNLPAWRNFPIVEKLAAATGVHVSYANDAGAAAFGEYWIGRGREFESIILITLGTGVGGGIIIGGMSIDGAHSHGAEIGHMTIDSSPSARLCSCGQAGHLEAYTSARSVVARTLDRLTTGESSQLSGQITEASPLTALKIAGAAASGDNLAKGIVLETAEFLADGISSLAHVIDPSAVLLGGAMNFGGSESDLGREFLQRIRVRVAHCTFPIVAKNLTIDFATLGSNAGFVGAAGLARREYMQSNRVAEHK